MARSSLNAIGILSPTACNAPRTDEAGKWNTVADSLKAVGQKGQVVASGNGLKLTERTLPLCGTHMNQGTGNYSAGLDYIMNIPFGPIVHTTYFEQPSFQTVGASSSPDKFALHLKFAISDFLGPEASGIVADADLGGKIVIELQNAGGTHELYSVETHKLGSTPVVQELVSPPSNTEYQEYDRAIYGQLPTGLVPPASQTYDSKLIITVSDIWFNYSATPSEPIFLVDNITDPAAYIGLFAFTLRLYNDG